MVVRLDDPDVAVTTDGGRTWMSRRLPEPNDDFPLAVFCGPSGMCEASGGLGSGSFIARSTDGGLTRQQVWQK